MAPSGEPYVLIAQRPAATRTTRPARVLVLLGSCAALIALAGLATSDWGGRGYSLAAQFSKLVGVSAGGLRAPDDYADTLDSPNALGVMRPDVVRAAEFTFARLNQDRIMCSSNEFATFSIRSASDQMISGGARYFLQLVADNDVVFDVVVDELTAARQRITTSTENPHSAPSILGEYQIARIAPQPCPVSYVADVAAAEGGANVSAAGPSVPRPLNMSEPLAAVVPSAETVNVGNGSFNASEAWVASLGPVSLAEFARTRLGYKPPSEAERARARRHTSMLLQDPPRASDIPAAFDARARFPSCKAFEVLDQKACGSCYAFAATSALAARMCADSEGQYNVVLSAQQAVSCMGRDGCEGGNAPMVYYPMETEGLVAEWCMPYESKDVQSGGPKCGARCTEGMSFTIERDSLGLIEDNVQAMQAEILAHGPVFASFYIYSDFMLYTGGVYQASAEAKAQGEVGGHAVMVVGWGTDEATGLDYWLCQNSWSSKWGDGGFFKIRRGTDECSMESWGFWFATPRIPQTCGEQRCAHAGELIQGCGCRCDHGWDGEQCGVCPVTCGRGGKLDPRRCACVCRPGFSGPRCDKQLEIRQSIACVAAHGTPEWPELHWDIAEGAARMVPGGFMQLFAEGVEPWTAKGGWAEAASPPIRVCGDKAAWAPGKTCSPSGMLKVPRLTKAGTYTLYWAKYLGNNEFGVSRGYQQPLEPVYPAVTIVEECAEVAAAKRRIMLATIRDARAAAGAELELARLQAAGRARDLGVWATAAAKVAPSRATASLIAPLLAFGALPVQYALPADTPAGPRSLGLFPAGQEGGAWYRLGEVSRDSGLQGEVSLDVSGVPPGLYTLVMATDGTPPSPPPPPPPLRTKWTRRVPHPVLIGHAASLTGTREADTPVEVARAHLRFEYQYSPASIKVEVGWGVEPATAVPGALWVGLFAKGQPSTEPLAMAPAGSQGADGAVTPAPQGSKVLAVKAGQSERGSAALVVGPGSVLDVRLYAEGSRLLAIGEIQWPVS